jgi:hypothetical protein
MVRLLLLVFALLSPVAVSADPARQVRGTEPRIAALIEAGIARSAAFRSLVAALDQSDVIVYIEPRNLPPKLGGYLIQRVFAREPYRYLRLVVNIGGSEPRLIGVIAHELQHALEIAAARDVRRTEEVEPLFKRIGFRGQCPRVCYETIEAIDAGLRVRNELARPDGGPAERVAALGVGLADERLE